MPSSWRCPYCDQHTTVTDRDISDSTHDLSIVNKEGCLRLHSVYIVCPNPDCKKTALSLTLSELTIEWFGNGHRKTEGEVLQVYTMRPQSRAQSLPDYIPEAVRSDYGEACLIVELSPKASATLSRRCLQGIIRDFWGIKPGRLVDEIAAIKTQVDPLTWQAIEAVRTVGNIGAHMEKDIDLIVNVEPSEAELLIGLIETLIKDWYIQREERQRHLSALAAMATQKQASKKGHDGLTKAE